MSNRSAIHQLFGITAPTTQEVGQRLQVALQWSATRQPSESWYVYVKSQEGMAWKDALETLRPLKAAFQLASTANPALLKQYPALARLLGAQTVIARRAATTRAANAKAEAAKNAATVAALPPATATAATASTPTAAVAESVPAAGRVVTVQG